MCILKKEEGDSLIQDQRFGIEIEMTGITRQEAIDIVADYFQTVSTPEGSYYDAFSALDSQGRKWKVMYDGSITTQKKNRGTITNISDSAYSVELVSPICQYQDIETIQEIVRKLRATGAIANDSTGIHVHIDASPYDASKLRNIANIMRSKEDILYKALQVNVSREHTYCKKVDDSFIENLNQSKPKSKEKLEELWYKNYTQDRNAHYHNSRYHALNLHSVFNKGTIEFRLFNGTMHAGKVKTYIQLSLAISNQTLSQSNARYTRTKSTNEKYTFRTWLLRLGMIGDEFKTARNLLLEHLEGNIAWKDPAQAEKQKQRLAERKAESAVQEPTEDGTAEQETSLNCEIQYMQGRGLIL